VSGVVLIILPWAGAAAAYRIALDRHWGDVSQELAVLSGAVLGLFAAALLGWWLTT